MMEYQPILNDLAWAFSMFAGLIAIAVLVPLIATLYRLMR